MTSFKEYDEKTWTVKKLHPKKVRDLNPKTNRMKNFKRNDYLTTDIPPEKRSFKNLPKYSTGKSKVRFQDWLMIKGEKRQSGHSAQSFGKSEADGKWYGWSHRAVYGFKKGDRIEGDNGGKKVEFPKLPNGDMDWDNGKYEDDFTIKSDEHAKEVAIRFADSVS